MVDEYENMKKLRNRNIFEKIKKKVTPIKDTSSKGKEFCEQELKTEYKSIIDDIFGNE